VPPVAWWLLGAHVFWTIAYDTAYAMVDRNDDVRIGMKTSAILFGERDVLIIMLCHGLFLGAMFWIGVRFNLGVMYFVGILAAAALAVRQYFILRPRTRETSFKAFLHNNWIGAAIFAGIVADFALRIPAPWIRVH
jgi:4-hydroxybenzoate polyprenyltransferase